MILNNLNCPNTEEMTQGLSLSVNPYELFDIDWYNKFIKTRMQEILLNKITIITFSEKIADEKLNEFINSANKCHNNNIANREFSVKWRNRMKDSIKTITIEEINQ